MGAATLIVGYKAYQTIQAFRYSDDNSYIEEKFTLEPLPEIISKTKIEYLPVATKRVSLCNFIEGTKHNPTLPALFIAGLIATLARIII